MPDWKSIVASRLSPFKLRPEREREIIDELSQHLGDRYQELRSDGVDHDEAMRLVTDEIDDESLLARGMQTLRQASAPVVAPPGMPRRGLLSDIWQDLGYAGRLVRKSPGFSCAVVLTLALGIGANTAIFSLVNATMLQRLPVQNHERLFYVFRDANGSGLGLSFPVYAMLRDNARLPDSLVAWGGITASLSADGETDMVSGAIVTGRYFDTLGVTAFRGRLLGPADDVTPGAHPVAVISYRLWQRHFGGRSDIVGHEVRLNSQVFTIVGVTYPNFPGAQLGITQDLYVPTMMQASMRPPRAGYSGEMNPDLLQNPNNGWLDLLVLLKPGVSPEQAQAELEMLLTTSNRLPGPRSVVLTAIDSGNPSQQRQLRSVALLLGSVVGVVLLIACANVANLLLSRAASRRREVAIRLALGASRERIVRQLLTESILLALAGGVAGVTLAVIVMQAFQAVPPPPGALPVAVEFTLDRGVLLFSLILSLATGILFGLAPARQASRPGLVPSLKDDSFVPDERARRFDLKKGLVVAEVALSVLLLIGAGLFLRSLGAIRAIDPGIAVSELVSAPINVNLLRYTKIQGREFYRRVVDRIEQLPGVASASVTRIALFSRGGRLTAVDVEGRDKPTADGARSAPPVIGQDAAFANVVGPGFFETIGVPLIKGRDFDARDLEDHSLVVIVSETMARQFFPGEDPIGKRLSTGFSNASGRWAEIVGIARDSKYAELNEGPLPIVYMPLSQRHETGVTLYVRSSIPAATLIPQVRREIQQLEPNLPLPSIQAMDETIDTLLYPQRMGANLLAVFGGLALFLASLGVYGVLAFSISRRRHELGVRMAIGADRWAIFSLVIREGSILVGIGLAIGLVAGVSLTELLTKFLFGVGARDAVTFAAVPCILATVSLLACYLPARRAMQVDPAVALRSE